MEIDYVDGCKGNTPLIYEYFNSIPKRPPAGLSPADERLQMIKLFENAASGICIVHLNNEGALVIEQGNRTFFEMDGISIINHIRPLFFMELQTKRRASNALVHLMDVSRKIEETFQISGIPFFFDKGNDSKFLLTCEKVLPVKMEQNKIFGLLTKREREILLMVINGDKNSFIAHRLSIAEGTVKKMLSNIYRKLSVSSRAELIRFCFENSKFQDRMYICVN